MTAEARQRLSEARLGDKNPNWKADKVRYEALHLWVRGRLHKPALCQMCFLKPPHDLANVTGIYTRDLQNWMYICRSCHMKSDGRLLARDKKGRWVSAKRIRIYSPLFKHARSPNYKIYPNIFPVGD